jgi:hypothetical protein
MLFDLFTLDNDFGYDTEDAERYAANVHMETFLLLRELLHTCEMLEEEVIILRDWINDLTTDYEPFPNPSDGIPGESIYLNVLVKEVFENIFSEKLEYATGIPFLAR